MTSVCVCRYIHIREASVICEHCLTSVTSDMHLTFEVAHIPGDLVLQAAAQLDMDMIQI